MQTKERSGAEGTLVVAVAAYTLAKIEAGAYFWMFLNWVRGLQDLGCTVVWLDLLPSHLPAEVKRDRVATLAGYLARLAAGTELVVLDYRGGPLHGELARWYQAVDTLRGADLLLNLGYDLPASVLSLPKRTAFVDIDPGLTQIWLSRGELDVARHDTYFTMAEGVGTSDHIPTCGLNWVYTPPHVHIPSWSDGPAVEGSTYSTASNWWGEWITIGDDCFENSKRFSYLQLVSLASMVPAPLELSIPLDGSDAQDADRHLMESHGWHIRDVATTCPTPYAAREYIRGSRGEISCVKPAYAVLETAWAGERMVNYLASGRPVITSRTGRSSIPRGEGLLDFGSVEEAAHCIRRVEQRYDHHARAARDLAKDWFDSQKVVAKVLERAL